MVLVGLSGGAAFAGGLLLDDPARYAGTALLYGTLPFDAGLATGHGTKPPAPLVARRDPVGHGIAAPALAALSDWLADRLGSGPKESARRTGLPLWSTRAVQASRCHVNQPDAPGLVVDAGEESRFVRREGGEVAQLLYQVDGDRLLLIHTEVPGSLGGRGIGARLVRAAVEKAIAQSLTIVPWCPFARRWLREHPDVAAGVPIDWKAVPR